MSKSEARKPRRPISRPGSRVNQERRCNAGVIRPDEVYTLEECAVRLEQGSRTIREAFNQGLDSMFFGKRKYVLGADLIRFLQQFRTPSKPAKN